MNHAKGHALKRHALLTVVWGVAAVALTLPSLASAAPGCNAATRKCAVEVGVTGSPGTYAVTFNPDKLHVKESEIGKEYRIVFIVPPGFIFKPAQGDGVVFKVDDQDEFYSNHVTDDENGNASTKKKGWRRYNWRFINSVLGTYSYKIQFRDTNNNVITGDPVITNIDTH